MHWLLLALAALAALWALADSLATITAHLANYRRPELQRSTLRILWMVPVFALCTLTSLYSTSTTSGSGSTSTSTLVHAVEGARDVYEALVIYAFFTLLVGYLGGERNLLATLQGRRAVRHAFPLSAVLPPLEMRRPETFLAVRRGILQFVVVKPVLALATLALRALGYYEEGLFAWGSSYAWLTAVYNVSALAAIYCLTLFYVQCAEDLAPCRPVPKFVCVKALVFLTWYQGIAVNILFQLLGSQGQGQSGAVQVQNLLICLELPILARMHKKAFPYQEFMPSGTSHSARLSLPAAARDAFGVKDLVQDAYHTFVRGTTFSSKGNTPAVSFGIDANYATARTRGAGSNFTSATTGATLNPGIAFYNDVARGVNQHTSALVDNNKSNINNESNNNNNNNNNNEGSNHRSSSTSPIRGAKNSFLAKIAKTGINSSVDLVDEGAVYAADNELDAEGDAVPENLRRIARRQRKKQLRRQKRILLFGADATTSPSFINNNNNNSNTNNIPRNKVYGSGNFFGASSQEFNNPRWWSYDDNASFYRANARSASIHGGTQENAVESILREGDDEAIMALLDWTDVEFSSPSSDSETEELYNYAKTNLDFGDYNYPVVPDAFVARRMDNGDNEYTFRSRRSRRRHNNEANPPAGGRTNSQPDVLITFNDTNEAENILNSNSNNNNNNEEVDDESLLPVDPFADLYSHDYTRSLENAKSHGDNGTGSSTFVSDAEALLNSVKKDPLGTALDAGEKVGKWFATKITPTAIAMKNVLNRSSKSDNSTTTTTTTTTMMTNESGDTDHLMAHSPGMDNSLTPSGESTASTRTSPQESAAPRRNSSSNIATDQYRPKIIRSSESNFGAVLNSAAQFENDYSYDESAAEVDPWAGNRPSSSTSARSDAAGQTLATDDPNHHYINSELVDYSTIESRSTAPQQDNI